MAGMVIIFDFDETIIECDSYKWVLDQLGASQLFETLLPNEPWNALWDRMMTEIHAQGKTAYDIGEILKRAPLDRHVTSAIKYAYALGFDLRIVSDANVFFIEESLKHHGLIECFTEINTNPSYVDEDGWLRISPYHDFTKTSHGCLLCPSNMCKSKIVERICSEGKRIVYLGDGKGDYCPTLFLGQNDFVMPRKNYPLWDLIQSDASLVKAEVHEWSYGEEEARVLMQIISRSEHVLRYMSEMRLEDCKLELMPGKVHEPLQKAVRAPL